MLEKRLHKRRHLIYYLRAIDNASGLELGRVGDISPGGVLLVSKKALQLKTEYNINIELFDLEETKQQQLAVNILPMWTREDANPEYLCTGSRFINITERDKLIIMDIVQSIGFLDGEGLPQA